MHIFMKKKITEIIIAIGILLLASFIRIYRLTIIPVFVDEAIYIRWAQIMRAEQSLRFLPLSDGKQPLFMWISIPFLKIFSDPLFAGRLVSVLTGIGTLSGIFILCLLLIRSKKVAFLASFIYAVSPFSVFFDRLALADSMLSMFGVYTLIFAVLTIKKLRLDTAMLTGFSLGGAFLTKSPALYFAVLAPSVFILSSWPKKIKEKFNKASIYVFLFSSTFIIAFAMYNILRLGPNFQMIDIRNKDYVYPLSHILQFPLDPFKPFIDRSREYFFILGPVTFVVLTLLGAFNGLRKHPKETLLLGVWGMFPILMSSEFSKTMTARYIYFSFPYFAIIAALSIIILVKENSKNIKPVLIAANLLFALFILQSAILNFHLLLNPQKANLPRSERSGYLEDWTAGYGIKEVSDYIKLKSKQGVGNQIVVGTEGYFGTLPDGLQMYLNSNPEIVVIGVGEPIRELPKSLAESKKAGNNTYLVVNSTRLLNDPDKLGLNLINSYKKAIRPDGSQESLLFFEVK